jgi:hypothetical protein
MKKISADGIYLYFGQQDDIFFYKAEEVEALIKFVEEKLLPNVLDNKEVVKEWNKIKND